jgi:ABC-type lipoprotein export system ATPase subunit
MLRKKISTKDMESRAMELLELMNFSDLSEKVKQKPTKLSGGERQRVAIARALVNHPTIILADEPTGALDSRTTQMILDLLKDIHQKENVTLVMVTHEQDVGEQADRIVTVLDGKIEERKA